MKRSLQHPQILSQRERLCILLSAQYALGKREKVLALMQKAIIHQHIPRAFFAELFIHLSLLIGFPNMLDGLEKLAQVKAQARRVSSRPLSPRQLQSRGLKLLRQVYGRQTNKLLGSLATIHADLPRMIVQDVYGKIIARRGLSISERELVNVTVLTIQGLHRQQYSHIRGALRVGVPPAVLRTLFRILKSNFRVRIDGAERNLEQLIASKN